MRKAACNSVSLLIDPFTNQSLPSSTTILPSSASRTAAQLVDRTKGTGPLLLLFSDLAVLSSGVTRRRRALDMVSAVADFLLHLVARHSQASDIERMGAIMRVMLHVAAALLPFACPEAQSHLLWTLVQGLDDHDDQVRATSDMLLRKVAERLKVQPEQLLLRHSASLHPMVLQHVITLPRLIERLCADYMPSFQPRTFIDSALPDVLPQLIVDSNTDVLAKLSDISGCSTQQLVIDTCTAFSTTSSCHPPTPTPPPPPPLSPSSPSPTTNYIDSTRTFLSRHLPQHNGLGDMIVLCGHSVLIEFVWSLGSEDDTTIRRAERLVWSCCAPCPTLPSSIVPSRRRWMRRRTTRCASSCIPTT